MVRTLVSRVRPAPLQSALVRVLRLDRPTLADTHGMQLLVDPSSVGGSQMLKGTFEPELTSLVQRYLSPGATFVDLGANIGYFTVLGSRIVGPKGTVIAVEPQSRLQRIIARNLQLNDCYNVRLVQAVISDRTGQETLHLSSLQNSGSSSLHRATRYKVPTEQVASWTLGDFLDRAVPGPVDFMKIDIEGAEYELLMAGEAALRSGIIRNLSVDFHHSTLKRRGLSAQPAQELLLTCGYHKNEETGIYER